MELLEKIIEEGAISNANLRLLIDEIMVFDVGGAVSLVCAMKAPFDEYGKLFDKDGNMVFEHYEEQTRLRA